MGEFQVTEKSSLQNKIKISKNYWPKRWRSWIFDEKTGQLYWSLEQEMVIYSLLHRRDVMAILSTGFGKSMIFIVVAMAKEDNVLIENLYDHNFASKKVDIYRWPNFRNVVVELYSTGAYDRNSKFALRKSTSIFSITHVTDNNALHRMVLAIVVDEERSTPELSMLGVALV